MRYVVVRSSFRDFRVYQLFWGKVSKLTVIANRSRKRIAMHMRKLQNSFFDRYHALRNETRAELARKTLLSATTGNDSRYELTSYSRSSRLCLEPKKGLL